MFCAPRLDFAGIEGVRSRFHVLRSRTRFRRYRGRLMPFSYFLLPDMFFGVPRVPCLFSCSALSVSFSAVPRASGSFFMFCAPGLIVSGTASVGSSFHVLHSRIRFRRYRGVRVSFSCSAIPDSFSAVSTASYPVVMFSAPGYFRRYQGGRVAF
jgi:hypothetical protein